MFCLFSPPVTTARKTVTPAPKTRMGGLNGHALCDLIFHLQNGASSEKFIETLFFCSNIKAYKHKHTHMKDTTYIYMCVHIGQAL